VANAKDVLAMGEEAWRLALEPLSYGLETVRGRGFNNLQRPVDLGKDDIWDWAGVEGEWCGSYAFLEYVHDMLSDSMLMIQATLTGSH
jgi:hypothetical protein